jgi:hypothetical protein
MGVQSPCTLPTQALDAYTESVQRVKNNQMQ